MAANGRILDVLRNGTLTSVCALLLWIGGCPQRQDPKSIVVYVPAQAPAAAPPAAKSEVMVIEEPAPPARTRRDSATPNPRARGAPPAPAPGAPRNTYRARCNPGNSRNPAGGSSRPRTPPDFRPGDRTAAPILEFEPGHSKAPGEVEWRAAFRQRPEDACRCAHILGAGHARKGERRSSARPEPGAQGCSVACCLGMKKENEWQTWAQ